MPLRHTDLNRLHHLRGCQNCAELQNHLRFFQGQLAQKDDDIRNLSNALSAAEHQIRITKQDLQAALETARESGQSQIR